MVAELTSSGVSQPADEERRIARDGKAYTWLAFMEFYGESAGEKVRNRQRGIQCTLQEDKMDQT